MSGLGFDDATSRLVEVAYGAREMVAQRAQVIAALAAPAGGHVLDLGCGPGFLAADLTVALGPDGRVTALDASESMLALARTRVTDRVRLLSGDVARLPFDDSTFDGAVSTQVYEYVPDLPQALAELRRVLRPGARAVIIDTDMASIVWHSEDPARMRRLLTAWDEHLADPHVPRHLARLARAAGLQLRQATGIGLVSTDAEADVFARSYIGFISAFAPGHAGVTQQEAQAWAAEQHALSARGEFYLSLTRSLFVVER